MIFTMIQVGIVSASAYQSGDYTYDLIGDSPNETAKITDYSGTASILYIHGILEGYTVTSIGAQVFENNKVHDGQCHHQVQRPVFAQMPAPGFSACFYLCFI